MKEPKPFVVVNKMPDDVMGFVWPEEVAGAWTEIECLRISTKQGGLLSFTFEDAKAAQYALKVLMRLAVEVRKNALLGGLGGSDLVPQIIGTNGLPFERAPAVEAFCQGDSRCGWSYWVDSKGDAPEICPECGGSVGFFDNDLVVPLAELPIVVPSGKVLTVCVGCLAEQEYDADTAADEIPGGLDAPYCENCGGVVRIHE